MLVVNPYFCVKTQYKLTNDQRSHNIETSQLMGDKLMGDTKRNAIHRIIHKSLTNCDIAFIF